MYLNGNGFRAISPKGMREANERINKVNHNTVIRWVRQAGNQLPESNDTDNIPLVAQLDELQTFIGKLRHIY